MDWRRFLLLGLFLGFLLNSGISVPAQEDEPHIHVIVNMVQLNVAVTDTKGNYITGLRPEDFAVTEDGIKEKIATFAEGNEPARRTGDLASEQNKPAVPGDQPGQPGKQGAQNDLSPDLGTLVAGANVFILFDTSNYMYRGFVFAQDAIAEFIRSLDTADKIAFYSYSRDLLRAASLTPDRSEVLRGVRTTVAGDDAALYNCLLLTVKDAATFTGRKVVVVFSNGPDNASMVPPEDVAELAQSTGIPIYMISTRTAQLDPISTAVFGRMAAATGGKAYFAKTWKDERDAFASIKNDLAHLYSLAYYPQANPNRGWRAINVKLTGERVKKYNIRTRNGYRPQPTRFSEPSPPASVSQTMPQ